MALSLRSGIRGSGVSGPPPDDAPATAVPVVDHGTLVCSTVFSSSHCRTGALVAPSFGAVLKQAREVREMSAGDTARAAGISAAYLSKLENDAVKKPSPPVLHQLSEALAVPYAELMRLSGYQVPGGHDQNAAEPGGAPLFADRTAACPAPAERGPGGPIRRAHAPERLSSAGRPRPERCRNCWCGALRRPHRRRAGGAAGVPRLVPRPPAIGAWRQRRQLTGARPRGHRGRGAAAPGLPYASVHDPDRVRREVERRDDRRTCLGPVPFPGPVRHARRAGANAG